MYDLAVSAKPPGNGRIHTRGALHSQPSQGRGALAEPAPEWSEDGAGGDRPRGETGRRPVGSGRGGRRACQGGTGGAAARRSGSPRKRLRGTAVVFCFRPPAGNIEHQNRFSPGDTPWRPLWSEESDPQTVEWVQERRPEGGRATRRKVAGDGSEGRQNAARSRSRSSSEAISQTIPKRSHGHAAIARQTPEASPRRL